ncbi:MAG: FHA domain-containing protein [Archangium sp.]
MTSPFAEYELTQKPPFEMEISMAVGSRFVLDPAAVTTVSRRRSDQIYVQGSDELFRRGWGGTQNHHVRCDAGTWLVSDLGHHSPIWVNDTRISGPTRALKNGDRVAPARGLVFTFFHRDDLEPLASELATRVEVLRGEERVLIDWLLERGLRSREEAQRAVTHFRYRIAASGGL